MILLSHILNYNSIWHMLRKIVIYGKMINLFISWIRWEVEGV